MHLSGRPQALKGSKSNGMGAILSRARIRSLSPHRYSVMFALMKKWFGFRRSKWTFCLGRQELKLTNMPEMFSKKGNYRKIWYVGISDIPLNIPESGYPNPERRTVL
jgi:hypothetical protein